MTDDIKKACEALASGGIILYPTDTIWGIGCDATNETAVKRVYDLKRRTDNKAMLVLLDSAAKLNYYIDSVPDLAYDLLEIAEKPLTIIYDHARNVAPNLIADDGSLAIRITNEKFSNELCRRYRKALVSTSANISGQPSPQNFSEISGEIKSGVDYIVQFGQSDLTKSKPSGIIKLSANGEVKVIRE
ncbi:MAG: threonylcarbamoyl-AMP synthase [Prevotella sp.]|jgi:L-threonylcarbamoyladenylate synthase|nr:threonylcarbamoyl-AMP synthase [Prevotella sp.]